MSIAHAPSKLAWHSRQFMRLQVINKIPFLRARYERRQINETYRLAVKAANQNVDVRVLDSGWANQSCLTDDRYKVLTSELAKISVMIGAFASLRPRVPVALHWSRRYEYPLAIMNSVLSEPPPSEYKILDSGANIDPVQFYLAMRGYNVYSLDLDLHALERVAQLKLEKRLKNLYPTHGNVLDLPFPDNYFDRVINISVLEHIVYHMEQDTNTILKGFVNESIRVLKPDGLIVLTFDVNINPKKSDSRLFFDEYESLCRVLGISPTPPPRYRLCSSDTEEGRLMGEDLCAYYIILTRN